MAKWKSTTFSDVAGKAGGNLAVEIDGLDELFSFFDNLDDELAEQFAKSTMKKAGDLVATEAKTRCPVDTGKLRESISARQFRNGKVNDVQIGTNVKYGKYVEYGFGHKVSEGHEVGLSGKGGVMRTKAGHLHQFVKARPFMRGALSAKADEVTDLMEKELETFVAEHNRK